MKKKSEKTVFFKRRRWWWRSPGTGHRGGLASLLLYSALSSFARLAWSVHGNCVSVGRGLGGLRGREGKMERQLSRCRGDMTRTPVWWICPRRAIRDYRVATEADYETSTFYILCILNTHTDKHFIVYMSVYCHYKSFTISHTFCSLFFRPMAWEGPLMT